MAIQITQDPINNFMDNLPRYALDLRRMEIQKDQFNQQMDLRKQAAERDQTIFEQQQARNQYVSDLIESMQEAQFANNKVKRDIDSWAKENAELRDEFENYDKSFIGNIQQTLGVGPKNLLEFMETKTKDRTVTRDGITTVIEPASVTQDQIDEYKDLINRRIKYIEPKEIPIPEGVILDESLLNYMNMAEKQRLSTMSFIGKFLSEAGFNYRTDPLQTVGTLR